MIITSVDELDALPVGSVLLGQSGAVWQRMAFRDRWRSHTDGAYTFTEDLAGDDAPFTLLHVPGRDLLAEARAEAVVDYMTRKEIPRIEISNPEQIRPFIAHEVAEAEARGYERGKRDALTEAADALIPAPPVEISASAALIIEWLRARAAETPGGAA